MKNGIAASGNLLIAPNISLTMVSRLTFDCQAPTMAGEADGDGDRDR